MSNVINFPPTEELQGTEEVDQVTQEYLDAIGKVVKNSDELKKINELADQRPAAPNVLNDIPKGVEMEEVVVQKNLLTGATTQLGTKEDYNFEPVETQYGLKDILDGTVPETIDEAIVMNLKEVKAQIKDDLGNISDEETLAIMDLVKLYQQNNNLPNMFGRLPVSLQNSVRSTMMKNGISPNKKMYEMYTEYLLSNIISGVKMDRFQVELNSELVKVTNEGGPELIPVILDQLKGDAERFKKARGILEETKDEVALKRLDELIDATNDATHFVSFKKALSERSIKVKKFDLEKPDKLMKYFDAKYERSPYTIKSIYCIPAVLDRVLDKAVTGKQINLFTILFAKMCENKKIQNPADHALMYYTINTITYLEVTAIDNPEFTAEKERILTDLRECMDIIKEKYANIL